MRFRACGAVMNSRGLSCARPSDHKGRCAPLPTASDIRAQTPAHGDRNRYLAGCRCWRCTTANTDYHREWKAEAHAGRTPRRVHGTRNGYKNYGCRCARCMECMRVIWRHERKRRRATS